jgi:hypothetical protein
MVNTKVNPVKYSVTPGIFTVMAVPEPEVVPKNNAPALNLYELLDPGGVRLDNNNCAIIYPPY